MKKRIIFFCLFSCLAAANHEPENYQAVFYAVANGSGKEFIALRTFEQRGIANYLLVDTQTSGTLVTPRAGFKVINSSASPYLTALQRSTAAPWLLQNQGLTRSETSPARTAFLTVDLCPSTRQFDQAFFKRLLAGSHSSPFPVGISVSGLWIARHPQAFTWLQKQRNANRLAITWVNHTYNHRYIPGRPNNQNFLLLPQTDVREELLANERLLLSHNETPSVFVRFPGLIADRQVTETVRELGLIPLGAEAWLAKGQKIRDGSVVLVHGNGNEPAGLRMINEALLTKFSWLPLAALVEEERAAASYAVEADGQSSPDRSDAELLAFH